MERNYPQPTCIFQAFCRHWLGTYNIYSMCRTETYLAICILRTLSSRTERRWCQFVIDTYGRWGDKAHEWLKKECIKTYRQIVVTHIEPHILSFATRRTTLSTVHSAAATFEESRFDTRLNHCRVVVVDVAGTEKSLIKANTNEKKCHNPCIRR